MIWFWIVGVLVLMFGVIVLRGAPYVPSMKRYVREAFNELYPLSKKDVLVDVGSGDGVVLRLAAEKGSRAIGYELNPILVAVSRVLSRRYKNVTIEFADFWFTKLPSNVTVVYAFTASPYIKKMTTKMQSEANRLGRPIRFILHGNTLADRIFDKKVGAYTLYTFSPLQTDEP